MAALNIASFWINVEEDVDRAQHMQVQFRRHALGELHTRVNAFTPSSLPPLHRKEPNYADDVTYARMCSHVLAQYNALKSGADWSLILEDDMVFLEDYEGLRGMLEEIPEDAGVLQLFTCNPDVYGALMASTKKYAPRDPAMWHVGAYLVSRSAIEKNIAAFLADGNTYDFRETSFPTNPEAVVYDRSPVYIATKTILCVEESIPSKVYPTRFTDQIYSNFLIRDIRRAASEGCNFVFVLSAGMFSSSNELIGRLNKETYMNIKNETAPVLPWIPDEDLINAKIETLSVPRSRTCVGDAGNYYLSYVLLLIEKFGTRVKFVCLRDDRTSCVSQFMKLTPTRNHWIEHHPGRGDDQYGSDGVWDKCFPTYKHSLLKSDLIGKYWDEYHETAQRYQDTNPDQFRIFSGQALNIDSIYKFLRSPKRIFR